MALKLMYITNRLDVAGVAQLAGVDILFVDMEHIGKSKRQKGMNTVQSNHTVADVKQIRCITKDAQLLVRCNPIHKKTAEYPGSEEEIQGIIDAGADIIMLPYFKSVREVKEFLGIVDGRVKTCLLVETPEAVTVLDQILDLPGIDQVHIGLNDLSLGYGKKFMFELLSDGTVEEICSKCAAHHIPYGFGGIASLGRGMLPSEYVIKEHYRLGSEYAILSRSFCDASQVENIDRIQEMFLDGVQAIRRHEKSCADHPETYEENRREVIRRVDCVVGTQTV